VYVIVKTLYSDGSGAEVGTLIDRSTDGVVYTDWDIAVESAHCMARARLNSHPDWTLKIEYSRLSVFAEWGLRAEFTIFALCSVGD